MKKVKIILEYDGKLPEFTEKIFESILYSESHVDKNKIRIIGFNSNKSNNLKVCESCKSAFNSTRIIDEKEPILCNICYDYFTK